MLKGGSLENATTPLTTTAMVKGLFNKHRLRDVIRNFIFFPDSSKKEEKIVCRYPPVDKDEVNKEIFEQAENFKKYWQR